MVTIIAGPINSGKTTRLSEIYETYDNGDGFVSLKIMEGRNVKGFDLMKLSTGETKAFIRKSNDLPEYWAEDCRLGPYSFSKKAVDWVENEIEEFIQKGKNPLFLDEIGLLETGGKCFSKAVRRLVESGRDIYLSARDEFLKQIMEEFGLWDVEVIFTGERYA